jgi:predicted ATP-dependent endonuclease of OLD family
MKLCDMSINKSEDYGDIYENPSLGSKGTYKVGFNNFRRFLEFDPLEYRGVTFLVGRNNSGKSTLVKALLLINDYLKSNDISKFSIRDHFTEDANIMTFGRARNNSNKSNSIKFSYGVENFQLEIEISGNDDSTESFVHSFSVFDSIANLHFLFEPKKRYLTISKKTVKESGDFTKLSSSIEYLDIDIKRVQERINYIKSNSFTGAKNEVVKLVSYLNELLAKKRSLQQISKSEKSDDKYSYISEYTDYSMRDIVNSVVDEALRLYEIEYKKAIEGKKTSEKFPQLQGIKEDSFLMSKTFDSFYSKVFSSQIFYLGANSFKQSALFNIRDKNNALAQSIHDLYQLRISKGEKADLFIQKWMKQFEIGEAYKIEIVAGEAYRLLVKSNNVFIDLADKGTGSIQAMLLILRMAYIIHKSIHDKDEITILIEEPELNLHPALQSKLADLFLECNQLYDLRFMVETHSEYIIRRSQVLVAEKEFEVAPNENPFTTYYFRKIEDQQPYKLNYNADGTFDKSFGKGFFDEASSSTLEILKLKRQKES